jgi:hypothetical protein
MLIHEKLTRQETMSEIERTIASYFLNEQDNLKRRVLVN